MKISDIIKEKPVAVSMEVFPPKTDAAYEPIISAVDALSQLKPDFISVTYGAGGGTSLKTIDIASHIQNDLKTTALAHLTCISSSRDEVAMIIEKLKENNIQNILAMRGDIPQGMEVTAENHYKHAYELIGEVKSKGDFCIGAACYPEGHVECKNMTQDMEYLKAKVDCGVDFLTTQMFFDNNALYSFLYRAAGKGITVPVIAGIMPVTNGKQVKRIIELSGTTLTTRFNKILDKYGDKPEAMKQAGIAFATEQIIDLLANGVSGVHIYTMNKPDIAEKIMCNIADIIKP